MEKLWIGLVGMLGTIAAGLIFNSLTSIESRLGEISNRLGHLSEFRGSITSELEHHDWRLSLVEREIIKWKSSEDSP